MTNPQATDSSPQLAEQIQELLGQSGATPPAAGAPPSIPATASTQAADASDQTERASPSEEAQLLKQLDQMLANVAEEAIAADMHTAGVSTTRGSQPLSQEVLKAEDSPTAADELVRPTVGPVSQPSAGQPVATDAAANSPLTPVPASADAQPDGAAVQRAAAGAAGTASSATSTAAAPPAAPAAAFVATAQDVEAELRRDAAALPASSSPSQATGPAAAAEAPSDPSSLRDDTAHGGFFQELLFSICAGLSRPLDRVSPQVRTMVGYVALLTLFNGVLVTLWGLAKHLI